ncbi:MAG TPA: hypothetical protein VGD42_17775 [Lysobacter sp.]
MTDWDAEFRVHGSEWLPDQWVMQLCRVLLVAVQCAGVATLVWYCVQAGSWWGFLLAAGIFAVSILIQEAGHAMGALLCGATITRAQLGPIEICPLRDGVRMRWKRSSREYSGFVMSFPSPRKSFRTQMVVITVAGPMATMVAAVAGFAVAGRLGNSLGDALLGFAIFNAAHATANLLPWVSPSVASNGLQLLRWMRGIDEKDPQFVFVAFNARLISGERFGAWADDYLRVLERGPQPGPMFVIWTRLKLAQIGGEWDRVDEHMRQMEQQVMALSPPLLKALTGFIAIARCEAAFSRAMAGEPLDASPVEILGSDMGWLLPALRLRCQALECLLHRQFDLAMLRLQESEHWSLRSVDRSLEHGEAPLRQALAARIERDRQESARHLAAQP